MTEIPAGTIPERVPRPLSAKERKRLREANGGDAHVSALTSLADKFAKPERPKATAKPKGRNNNGWST